jgi:hypothetical protein
MGDQTLPSGLGTTARFEWRPPRSLLQQPADFLGWENGNEKYVSCVRHSGNCMHHMLYQLTRNVFITQCIYGVRMILRINSNYFGEGGIHQMPTFQGCLNSGFRSSAVGPCSTFLFAPLFISPPSPLPNALLSLQPTFVTRTSGHCLGTVIAVNLFLPYR